MSEDNSQPSFEQTGSIYMIHLPSGKKYIGQHKTNNIKERKTTHFHQFTQYAKKKELLNADIDTNLRNPTGYCTALYNAFNKYKFKKCVFVVMQNNILLNDLNEIEDKYIIEHNTIQPNGYNLKLNNANDDHKFYSGETLSKMSISQSKVFDTKLNSYRRNNGELEGLPKHVNFITKTNGARGFRIENHPHCKSKQFVSLTISTDILKQRVLDFLEQCEITSHESLYTTKVSSGIPKGIQKRSHGYEVQFSHNKIRYTKCFTNPSITDEESLKLAVEWLKLERVRVKDIM